MSLSLQDLLIILGPIGTLLGFMWHHSNTRFEKLDEKIDQKFEKLDKKIDNLRVELKGDINSVEKRLDEKIDNVEKRLGEKIDAVRDRVSRIEGQLAPASIVAYSPARHKETTRATHSS
jgi:hypothetical protein